MWLFSDLHALEVELWIHCFCTRHTPFKSSDCYHANLCLVWRFSTTSFFSCHNISFLCLRWKINLETLQNTVWNLDWQWVLESSRTNVLGYIRFETATCPGLFFTARVSSEPQVILHCQSVKQIFSGYFYGVWHHFIFCQVALCCLRCWDSDSGLF